MKMTIVIDENSCKLCGTCVKVCPWKAIKMNDKVTVNSEECAECGTCVESCPNVAIFFGINQSRSTH